MLHNNIRKYDILITMLRILLLVHSFNSLSQRLFVELKELGHEASIEFDINDHTSIEAISLFKPDLVIAPFLKRAIPQKVWSEVTCLIIHPGPPGDRGPSALDWAVLNGKTEWGVTVLQANEVMDGGDIWASETYPIRKTTKGSIYRQEVTEAAVIATLRAVELFSTGNFQPKPQTELQPIKPWVTQQQRKINWQQDSHELILQKINSADGFPGVLDDLYGKELYLYNAHPAVNLSGEAGEVLARSGDAICRATVDNKAIWIGHLRDKNSETPFKLSSTTVLANEIKSLPEIPTKQKNSYNEIIYLEESGIGMLFFSFYNGAMSKEKCQQLQQAYKQAKQQSTKAIILFGGEDYWSNGMDLNQIEAAESPADESWKNINAMDDLALEIMQTDKQLTISALRGNAGAGGVFLARAADLVWLRTGVILNPHYKDMGNLYGSEYWSYLLPKATGKENAQQIMQNRLPIGSAEAVRLKLADNAFGKSRQSFTEIVINKAKDLINDADFIDRLNRKAEQRAKDEATKPLSVYREQELEKMKMNFYGFDPSYHIARYNFVHKVPKSRTPVTLAIHRRLK